MTRRHDLSEADAYLLDQIGAGDQDAWSQLVGRYQGRMFAFARGQLGNAVDAEDAVQETFLSFLKGLAAFRREASLETFLFSLLRRRLVDLMRSKGRTARLHACLLGGSKGGNAQREPSSTDAADTADEMTGSWYARRDEDREIRRDQLSRALHDVVGRLKGELNFRDLTVCELLFYAQLRNQQIAELVGIDEKQVALLKYRFIRRLADRVGKQDAESDEQLDAHVPLLTSVWEEDRPSCPKRSTLGKYLLGTLDQAWHDYIAFHVDELGCQFCAANLTDLKEQTQQPQSDTLRDQILQSTVGFFSRAKPRSN